VFKKLAAKDVAIVFIASDIGALNKAINAADLNYKKAFFIDYSSVKSAKEGVITAKDLKKAMSIAGSLQITIISNKIQDAPAAKETGLNFILFVDVNEEKNHLMSYTVLRDLSLLPVILPSQSTNYHC
jgi:hypothetical protein